MGFWGFMGFEMLLSRASVTLDRHAIVICAVDMFLGQILRFFVVGALLSFPHIGHMLSLYKQQNVLDRILNFFLVIVKHVFRAFGMFFLRKYFLGYIFFGEQIFGIKTIDLKDYMFSTIIRFQIAKIYCVVDVIELAIECVF